LKWSVLHARCPHCNGTDAVGRVRRMVAGWLSGDAGACWEKGPHYIRVQAGMVCFILFF
jgi:hypothetical protein